MSSMSKRLGVALTVGLLLVPHEAVAARTPGPDVTMRRVEKRVASAGRIRLDTEEGRFELERPWLSQGIVRSRSDSLNYRLEEIRRIQAHRNYAGRGATVGLLSGAAVGGLVAAYAEAAVDSGQRSSSGSGGQAIGLVATGAAVGFGLGLLLGAASSGWKTIYELPPDTQPLSP